MSDGAKPDREINRTCTIRLGTAAQIVYTDGRTEDLPASAELQIRKVGRGVTRRLVVGIAFPLPQEPSSA